ncbi:uncharacterized protein LOC116138102 [Pistacia vera]|uniref:uncharacterized protein LOC116138102 n=1 Tax=Pistacia vera TaxID=55513 RepID=UPI001263B04D|nr:uncharacterized protein LOC116138102 [Pistacia vera]
MQPPSRHSSFFSSLKQVEKRLKLEEQTQHPSSSQPVQESDSKFTSSTESLGSPIYLQFDQTHNNSTLQESGNSEAPQAFLSLSPEFPRSTQQSPPQINPTTTQDQESNDVDDIKMLMQLLGISDHFEERNEKEEDRGGVGNCCECEGGFYEKIIGVKGPKCEKEVERLEGWIKYFLGSCKGEEPLRLAYLLMGKAAFALDRDECGFGGLEFPSTIDGFLKNDPPKE